MPLAITIDFAGDAVRLSQKQSSEPSAKTNVVVLPADVALQIKTWLAVPTTPLTVSAWTIEALDTGVRIMQSVNTAGQVEKHAVVMTPAQLTQIKAWFALYGSATAPESPLTVNP